MNNPSLYTRANNLQRRDVREFVGEFDTVIEKMFGRCLDIGSGPGDTVVDFVLPRLDAKSDLVCSDISNEMVNFGKGKYKDHDRLSYVKLNIESSTNLIKRFHNNFNYITSFYCIHWCHNLRQVFENIFNMLEPGGTHLSTFPANSPVYNAYPILAAMPKYKPYMKDVDRYIPFFQNFQQPCKTLEALIEDVGFEIRHCTMRKKNWIFKNFDTLSEFILAINPFIERMPADLTKVYKEDLVKEVLRQNLIMNNNISCQNECSSMLVHYSTFALYLRKP